EAVCEDCPPFEETQSSVEYTDSTGIDLHQFIVDTLNSNPRDRMMLLKLEQEMTDFITSNSPFKKFPHMSSYHRMLVHRVAAYFGMEHNVDQTGKSVIINRTSSTRIPEERFVDKVHKDKSEEIQQWKIILKRDNSSDDQGLGILAQTKGFQDNFGGFLMAHLSCGNKGSRIILDVPHRGSRDSSGSSWTGSSRQSSTETDCRYSNDPRPWSSTESDSSYQWTSAAQKTRSTLKKTSTFSYPTFDLSGQPFLNPDGTPVVYNPPDNQQPIRSQTQLQGSPPQQPQHMYRSAAPPLLCIEELSSQFAHVSCQSAGEAPPLYPSSQGYIYAAPPLHPPPPPNPASYCQPSPQVRIHQRFISQVSS
uniref:R3H domain-containing protein n=1 Tax=Oreochromis niloticus TaxID=8128 RepID=I3J202_ORENI